MEIDPKIVQMATQGGASAYGESRLRDIMAIPDYQTRAKNLSALRNSLEILNSRLSNKNQTRMG